MSAWRDILENGAARAFSAIANLAVLFVTARALGPAGRGVLVVATTWIALCAAFAGLSLGQVSHRYVGERHGPEGFSELVGTMLLLAVIASAVACVVVACLALSDDSIVFRNIPRSVIVLASLLLPFLVLDEYARNLLAAVGRVRSYSVAQVVGNLLRLGLVLLAVGQLHLGVPGVIAAILASQAVIVVIEARALWPACGRRLRFSMAHAKQLIGGALRLHPNTVASFLLVQANVLLLNQFTATAEVAWYQLAQQLAAVMLLIPQAGAMVLFGRVAQHGPDAVWPRQKQLMLQVLAAMALIGVVAALLAPVLIRVVAGPGFEPAAAIFRWVLLALIGMSLAELMAPQWFGRGIFLTSSLLTFVTALATIVLNAVLIRRYGVMGAAWGTAISYVVFVLGGQVLFGCWCEIQFRRHRVGNGVQ